MNADGSNQVNLTNNSTTVFSPAWSPDGAHIAYEVRLEGDDGFTFEIYVMNADGSEQRNLTNHPASDRHPTWSPDGSHIAFDTDRDGDFHQIYVMNTDGSDQTSLTNYSTNWSPSWSPDGARIVYQFNVEIFVMNADGSGSTRAGSKENYWKLDPDWSPDGTHIVFTRFDDTNQDGYVDNWQDAGDIYMMNIDGRDETRLTIDPATDESPCWGP
jgi:Tol biopolymer transport system component